MRIHERPEIQNSPTSQGRRNFILGFLYGPMASSDY